ncbi:hypothetical protein [Streptomyces sp. NPDC054765]
MALSNPREWLMRDPELLALGSAALELLETFDVADGVVEAVTSMLAALLDESSSEALTRVGAWGRRGSKPHELLIDWFCIDLRDRGMPGLPEYAPGASVAFNLRWGNLPPEALLAIPHAIGQLQSPSHEVDRGLKWDYAGGTTLAWDGARKSWVVVNEAAIAAPPDVLVGAAALYVLGQMGGAYLAKLGELLGESSARVLRRMWLRLGNRSSTLTIRVDRADTLIVLPDGELSDEAKLALIDLDVTADGIRGETLAWDPESQSWRGRPARPTDT